MRVLLWHVHGSWTTAFVQGGHDYLVPLLPDRSRDGLGRARTWDWPATVREVATEDLPDTDIDVAVLQRPRELDLFKRWTGRRAGVDVPAVFVEHNAPDGAAAATRHVLADQQQVPIVHVTPYNQVMWDCGSTSTTVIEHGVVDPGHRYTGERASLAVVVNEPVRRQRVAGTDLVVRMSYEVPVDVYGMGMSALGRMAPSLAGHLHEDLPQRRLHEVLGTHRAYFHPYRWTSLGLALVEAMTLGMPILALATTAAPEAVPADAGTVSCDLTTLTRTARRWLRHPEEARRCGEAARQHALNRFGLGRFLDDWDRLLKEVAR